MRLIHSQWFGADHIHPYYPYKSSPHQAEFKQDIEGLKFLSSTKYEGDNYIQVDMYDPIKMFIAEEYNINITAYYSLLLIKEK